MRLIDADALKDNMFNYAAPEMVWDRGDIEHKINEMPTIDAIPVEWLHKEREHCKSTWDIDFYEAVQLVLCEWQKEQEAQDG